MTGTITRIENCGSIVVIYLRTKRKQESPVYLDHRSFQHLLESEPKLIGRQAISHGETLEIKE